MLRPALPTAFCALPFLLLAAALTWPLASPADVPESVGFQGLLRDAGGSPLGGSVTLVLSLHDAPEGGNEVYRETHADVALSEGIFDVLLGRGSNPTAVLKDVLGDPANAALYLEVEVGDETLAPRQPLAAVHYALLAADADRLDGLTLAEIEAQLPPGPTGPQGPPGPPGPGAEAVDSRDLSVPVAPPLSCPRCELYTPDIEHSMEQLAGANLFQSRLRGTVLTGANLSGADLRGAEMGSADLQGASVRSANLAGADLSRENGGRIYWYEPNDDRMRSARLDGDDIENVIAVVGRNKVLGSVEIDLDVPNGHIYWGAEDLYRSRLDGSDTSFLRPLVLVGQRHVVDPTRGLVYWYSFNSDSINKGSLTGTDQTVVWGPNRATIADMELFPGDDRIHWAGFASGVGYVFINGSQQNQKYDDPLDIVNSIAIDREGRWSYYSRGRDIYRAHCCGRPPQTPVRIVQSASPSGSVRDMEIDAQGGKLYWLYGILDPDSASIRRANLDGTNVQTVVNLGRDDLSARFELLVPVGMADLDASYADFRGANLAGADLRGASFVGADLRDADLTGAQLSIDDVLRVLYTDESSGEIVSFSHATGTKKVVIDGLGDPSGVAYDWAAGRFYWVDRESGTLERARLDGSGRETLRTDLVDPSSLEIDKDEGYLFFSEESSNRIRRTDLDGENETTILTGLDGPRGIALDRVLDRLYWIDSGAEAVRSAGYDGSFAIPLPVTGLDEAWDLAIDATNRRIYWTNLGDETIYRANLDGTFPQPIVESGDGLLNPRGITVDSELGKVYWLSEFNRIGSARLDGSEVRLTTVPGGLRTASAISPTVFEGARFGNTICPDGSNSDDDDGDGQTCLLNRVE